MAKMGIGRQKRRKLTEIEKYLKKGKKKLTKIEFRNLVLFEQKLNKLVGGDF